MAAWGAGADSLAGEGDESEPSVKFAPTPADEVAFFQLSGGSRHPKLIPRTHDDYCYSVRRSNEICGLGSPHPLSVRPAGAPTSPELPGRLGCSRRAVPWCWPDPSPISCFPLIARHRVNSPRWCRRRSRSGCRPRKRTRNAHPAREPRLAAGGRRQAGGGGGQQDGAAALLPAAAGVRHGGGLVNYTPGWTTPTRRSFTPRAAPHEPGRRGAHPR